jgi:DNA-binding NtrC family response regulator
MGRKILVVDKDEAIHGGLEAQPRYWQYDVCLATDRMETQKLAHTYDPQIIIINVEIPDLLDVPLLTALNAYGRDFYLILISAGANCQLAVQGIKHGAFTILSKPLQYPTVIVGGSKVEHSHEHTHEHEHEHEHGGARHSHVHKHVHSHEHRHEGDAHEHSHEHPGNAKDPHDHLHQ